MSTVMPRSALRHRPIQSEVQEWVIATPRATSGTKPALPAKKLFQVKDLHPLILIGLGMLVTLLLLWVMQGLWNWGSMQLDTIRYGFPRTTQVEQAVGHGGVSSFLATNEHGQVYVLEIAGDDPANSHLLIGPYLLSSQADLAPVTLNFQGNMRHPDLIVEVQGIEMRFRNTGKTYVPVVAP